MRHTNMGHLPQEHPFEFYACVSMETTLCNLPSSFPLFPDIRVDVRPALLHVRLCGSINMCQIIFYIIIINYFIIFIDKLHTHTHRSQFLTHIPRRYCPPKLKASAANTSSEFDRSVNMSVCPVADWS